MVIAAEPTVAVAVALRVTTVLVPVVEEGLKLAETPVGKPLALKATLLVNPPVRVTVMLLVPVPPRLIVKLVGLAESVKLGVGVGVGVRLSAPDPHPIVVKHNASSPDWRASR